jgi:hypothetical protein
MTCSSGNRQTLTGTPDTTRERNEDFPYLVVRVFAALYQRERIRFAVGEPAVEIVNRPLRTIVLQQTTQFRCFRDTRCRSTSSAKERSGADLPTHLGTVVYGCNLILLASRTQSWSSGGPCMVVRMPDHAWLRQGLKRAAAR